MRARNVSADMLDALRPKTRADRLGNRELATASAAAPFVPDLKLIWKLTLHELAPRPVERFHRGRVGADVSRTRVLTTAPEHLSADPAEIFVVAVIVRAVEQPDKQCTVD